MLIEIMFQERLLYKFDVEIDTELASGVDDECVICGKH